MHGTQRNVLLSFQRKIKTGKKCHKFVTEMSNKFDLLLLSSESV